MVKELKNWWEEENGGIEVYDRGIIELPLSMRLRRDGMG